MFCSTVFDYNERYTDIIWDYPNITRPFSMIYYVVGGDAQYTIDNKTHTFEHNHLYIFPSNTKLSLYKKPEDKFYISFIHAALFPELTHVIDLDVKSDRFLSQIVSLIRQYIKKANTIAIVVHENPDGDAIGSALAMKLALKQLNKESDVIIPEYPSAFSFLPGVEEIKKESDIQEYDLAIALDCASIRLLNGFAKYFDNAKVKVAIDHHSSNTMYADYNYINQDSPACAQLLLVAFSYFGIEVTKEIGTCILAGIITDTGGFRYSTVTAETFRFVAELCEKGVKVSQVYDKVYSSKTRAKFELHRIALERLEFLEEGKIAFTYITKADEEKVGAENGDYDGIVENGRDVEGVEVSLFLRETSKGIKASIRSKNYVNAAEVAMMFSGGGHLRAAGCSNLPGSIEQVKNQMINRIRSCLK